MQKKSIPDNLMPKRQKPEEKRVDVAPANVDPKPKPKAKPKPKPEPKEKKVRFNVQLRESTYRAVKVKAVEEGKPAGEWLDELIRKHLKL